MCVCSARALSIHALSLIDTQLCRAQSLDGFTCYLCVAGLDYLSHCAQRFRQMYYSILRLSPGLEGHSLANALLNALVSHQSSSFTRCTLSPSLPSRVYSFICTCTIMQLSSEMFVVKCSSFEIMCLQYVYTVPIQMYVYTSLVLRLSPHENCLVCRWMDGYMAKYHSDVWGANLHYYCG